MVAVQAKLCAGRSESNLRSGINVRTSRLALSLQVGKKKFVESDRRHGLELCSYPLA